MTLLPRRRTGLLAATVLTLTATALPATPASAAPTWTSVTNLSDPNFLSTNPDLGVDAQGNVTAVWRRISGAGGSVVEVAYRPAGGTWSSPVPISDGTKALASPAIAVDPAGNATVVWSRTNGTDYIIQASSRPTGGTWSAPVDLSTGGASNYAPVVATTPSGRVTAAWFRYNGVSNEIQATSKAPGGTWTSAVDVSAAGVDSTDVAVAVDPSDRAMAVFLAKVGTEWVVQTTARPSGGTWSTPVGLSDGTHSASEPRVALTDGGLATVTWSWYDGSHGIIQATGQSAVGGPWSPPVDVSASTLSSFNDRVVLDASGNATLVWAGFDGSVTSVWASSRPANGAWSQPALLGSNTYYPDVAVDSQGTATASFLHGVGPMKDLPQASRRPLNGLWSAPVDLSTTPYGGDEATRIVVDPAGDATAMWGMQVVNYTVQAAGLDVAGPVTTLNAPGTATVGEPASFSATAKDTWSGVTTYAWSFGDGSTASGPTVSHTYAAPGSYPVSVTVSDAVGNTTTRTATVAVAVPVPAIGTFKLTRTKILALSRAVAKKTKLKIGLNTAATLKLVIKSKHRHVVKGKKKFVKVVIRKNLPAGVSKITIKAKVKGQVLKPDTYVLTGSARNASGTSPKKKLKLKVVHP